MTVRIYSSDDIDAPQLDGNPGTLISVLEAILVNGYGDKESLGWTKEFHEDNVAVFRNSTTDPESTGMFLRVDNSAGFSSQRTSVLVRAFKEMTDIDSGLDPTLQAQQYAAIYESTSTWFCIGDHRTFFLNRGSTHSSYLLSSILGAGDYIPFAPGLEGFNYFVTRDGRTNYTQSTADMFPNTGNIISIPRDGTIAEGSASWAQAYDPVSISGSPTPWGDRHYREVLIQTGGYIIGKLRGAYSIAENLGRTSMGQEHGYLPGIADPLIGVTSESWTTTSRGTLLLNSGDWSG